jgi:hypothetical protein
LLTQEDFLKPYAGSTVAARAVDALALNFMPPGAPLTATQKTAMLTWLDAGVPLSTQKCP